MGEVTMLAAVSNICLFITDAVVREPPPVHRHFVICSCYHRSPCRAPRAAAIRSSKFWSKRGRATTLSELAVWSCQIGLRVHAACASVDDEVRTPANKSGGVRRFQQLHPPRLSCERLHRF